MTTATALPLTPARVEAAVRGVGHRVVQRLDSVFEDQPVLRVVALLGMATCWILLTAPAASSSGPKDLLMSLIAPIFYGGLIIQAVRSFRPSFLLPLQLTAALSISYLLWLSATAPDSANRGNFLAALVTWLLPLLPVIARARGLISTKVMFTAIVALSILGPLAFEQDERSTLLHPLHTLIWTERLILPLSILLLEHLRAGTLTMASVFTRTTLGLYFHPLTFFYVLPLSSENLPEPNGEAPLRLARDLCLLISACTLKALDDLLVPWLNSWTPTVAPLTPAWFALGFAQYLHMYFLSYFMLNAGLIVGRLFGLRLAPGTHFALLATDPVERWRRWNAYYYAWLFRFVYVPVMRGARSEFLATQCVFFVTGLLHSGSAVALLLLPFAPTSVESYVRHSFVFFQLHGLALFATRFFPLSFRDPRTGRGWLGVLLTWMLMALVHTVRN